MYWNLIPAATKVATTAFAKPKKKDYVQNTSYLNKYIASLRGRKQESEIYKMMINPVAKAAGAQTARVMNNIDQSAAKNGTAGAGSTTQAKLSAQQNLLSNMTLPYIPHELP